MQTGGRAVFRRWGWRTVVLAFLGVLRAACSAAEVDEEAVASLMGHFEARRPTVRLQYRVSYCLCSLQLKRIGYATVEVTEGVWCKTNGAAPLRACIADFHLDTPDDPAATNTRTRVSLHNRITTSLTLPELEAIQFVKKSDERIHTVFRNKEVRNLEQYDMNTGVFRYHRIDHITGEVATNFAGSEQIVRQSKEVLRFMKTIFSFYMGRLTLQPGSPETRFYIYTEAALVPFDLTADGQREPIAVLGRKIPAVCLRAVPTREARGKGRTIEMWSASFEDVSVQTGADDLVALARQSMEWTMVPLMTEFGLVVGTVRCVLTDIHALPMTPAGGAAPVSSPAPTDSDSPRTAEEPP